MTNAKVIGEKIYFRPIEPEDLGRCLKWINDPEITQYLLAHHSVFNSIREREWIENLYKSESDIVFAICVKGGDQHIGSVGLHRIMSVDRFGVFGILIGEKDFQNRGYGTEATRLMINFAFDVLNLNRVELEALAHNDRAIRCYEKAGFRKEGIYRKRRFVDGRYVDEVVMSVLREERITK